jgi:hypothetical protein
VPCGHAGKGHGGGGLDPPIRWRRGARGGKVRTGEALDFGPGAAGWRARWSWDWSPLPCDVGQHLRFQSACPAREVRRRQHGTRLILVFCEDVFRGAMSRTASSSCAASS